METSSKSPHEAVESKVRESFIDQAGWCARLGSPFTALLCSTLAERLDASTPIGSRILAWPGDPTAQADALALRVCGALHGLARSNHEPELAALYANFERQVNIDELWRAIQGALGRHTSHFEAYLATAPQTNEVGRSGVLMCGFLEIAKRFDLPLQLFELGASAGLNLIADRYRYRFGDSEWGDPRAALLLDPRWEGPPPPTDAYLRVTERCGCDVAPLDITVAAERARLVSYIWPDQFDRLQRLERAMDTALRNPPRLERMDAADWVEQRIPEAATEPNHVRVLFHSIVWRYFPSETQRRIQAHMQRCGALAQADTPLAWLRFELVDSPPGTLLTLTVWPGGEECVLARSQPHGQSISYLDRS
jgi:hypothetical protein